MFAMTAPAGLMPQPLVDHWTQASRLTADLVPDCNHYTILFGARTAARIAHALVHHDA